MVKSPHQSKFLSPRLSFVSPVLQLRQRRRSSEAWGGWDVDGRMKQRSEMGSFDHQRWWFNRLTECNHQQLGLNHHIPAMRLYPNNEVIS